MYLRRGQTGRWSKPVKLGLALLGEVLMLASSTHGDGLNGYVAAEMRKQQIPGAVIVVLKDGRVVTQRAYGTANIEFGVPMKVENVFSISSITKLFTTVAVFELIQDGKLDDGIGTVVPGLPESWKEITALHCLRHTSGLPGSLRRPSQPSNCVHAGRGGPTWREAIRMRVTELRAIDTFHAEIYEISGLHSGYGFAAYNLLYHLRKTRLF